MSFLAIEGHGHPVPAFRPGQSWEDTTDVTVKRFGPFDEKTQFVRIFCEQNTHIQFGETASISAAQEQERTFPHPGGFLDYYQLKEGERYCAFLQKGSASGEIWLTEAL
jgi:hypothetical protein